MNQKICSTCKKSKLLEEFCAAPRNRDGRSILCKSCKSIYDKQYRTRTYSETKHQDRLIKQKQYRIKNRAAIIKKKSECYYNNLLEERKIRRAYQKRRWATDPFYRAQHNLRGRLRIALRQQRTYKTSKTMQLTGCSLAELKSYLESKFIDGMSWNNYGHGNDKWNVDHIIPCSVFDLTRPEEQARCFHYSNLQPLWQPDNFKKRNSLDWRP